MICRVLIKFNQNLHKKQAFKEHKLLTFKVLINIKDQLYIGINRTKSLDASKLQTDV